MFRFVFPHRSWSGETGAAILVSMIESLLVGTFSIAVGWGALRRRTWTPSFAAGFGGASLGILLLALRSADYNVAVSGRALREGFPGLVYAMLMPLLVKGVAILAWFWLLVLCLSRQRERAFPPGPDRMDARTLKVLFASSALGTVALLMFLYRLFWPAASP